VYRKNQQTKRLDARNAKGNRRKRKTTTSKKKKKKKKKKKSVIALFVSVCQIGAAIKMEEDGSQADGKGEIRQAMV
jgi:sRNA-binding protein